MSCHSRSFLQIPSNIKLTYLPKPLSEIAAIHKSCIMTLLNLLMNNLKTDTVCHIRIIFPELMHKDATNATRVSDGQCCLFAKNSSMHNIA